MCFPAFWLMEKFHSFLIESKISDAPPMTALLMPEVWQVAYNLSHSWKNKTKKIIIP